MYTTARIAEELGIGQSTVRTHVASGALPAQMLGKTWLISDVDFAVYKATRESNEEIAALKAQLAEANEIIEGLREMWPEDGYGGCASGCRHAGMSAPHDDDCTFRLSNEYTQKYLSEVNDGNAS